VTSATHLRHARWDLKVDGEVEVKLPEKNPEQALAYFLNLENQHHLLGEDVEVVDMRVPGKLILRLKSGTIQKKKTVGKDA
jgi:cell division protein FtsQ